MLAALGVIAIPGIGPLVAAGVLATTLVGAAGGGAVGGLLGALTDYGVSEEEAHVYLEGVRRGSSLVTVRTDDDKAGRAEAILDSYQPVNTRHRRESGARIESHTRGPNKPPCTSTTACPVPRAS